MGECGNESGDSEPRAWGSVTFKEGMEVWTHLHNNRGGKGVYKKAHHL